MQHRAFTIVEVVVVVAVMMLLTGLLVPALSSVAASGRSARCQSNLKQMATAAHTHAAMFDAFPAAIRYKFVNGVPQQVGWDWVMVGNTVIAPGTLWNYTDNPSEVMQCPDYHGRSNFGEEFTGYNYNTTYIGGEQMLGQAFRPGVPPHACNRSSHCAMFGDAGWKMQSNKYMRAPMRSEGPQLSLQAVYAGAQAFRHTSACNIAFVDGHVGHSKTPHKGHLATDSLLAHMKFPDNGFLSDDDSLYDPR